MKQRHALVTSNQWLYLFMRCHDLIDARLPTTEEMGRLALKSYGKTVNYKESRLKMLKMDDLRSVRETETETRKKKRKRARVRVSLK